MYTKFFTAVELAETLKISRALAYRLIAGGAIRSFRIGRTVRVQEQDLEEFIQSNSSGRTVPGISESLQTIQYKNNSWGEHHE